MRTPRPAATLAAALRRAALRAAIITGGLAFGMAAVLWFGVDAGSNMVTPENGAAASAQAQVEAATVDALIAAHDCWTDEAPVGAIPGHAVVDNDERGPRLASAEVGFGIWQDGEPGTLYAFCK